LHHTLIASQQLNRSPYRCGHGAAVDGGVTLDLDGMAECWRAEGAADDPDALFSTYSLRRFL